MLALLGLGASTTLASASVVVVVIVVVGLQNLASQLLLASVDIGVEFVAVLPDRELLVVVDGDVDATRAHGLVVDVVELGHVVVPQGLLCRKAPSRVELKQVSEKVKCVI